MPYPIIMQGIHGSRSDLFAPQRQSLYKGQEDEYPCFMQVCTGVTERPGPDPWVLRFGEDDRNPPIGLRGPCHGAE